MEWKNYAPYIIVKDFHDSQRERQSVKRRRNPHIISFAFSFEIEQKKKCQDSKEVANFLCHLMFPLFLSLFTSNFYSLDRSLNFAIYMQNPKFSSLSYIRRKHNSIVTDTFMFQWRKMKTIMNLKAFIIDLSWQKEAQGLFNV